MEEGEVDGKEMFVADQHAAELTEPGISAFGLPASLVAPQFPSILVFPLLVVLPVERDQLNASPFPSLPQRIGVVAAVGDYSLRCHGLPLRRGRDKQDECTKVVLKPWEEAFAA